MTTSVYTSLLIKDFKRKAGTIKTVRKDLREMCKVVLEMEREQVALLSVIRTREPNFNPSSVKPISSVPKVLGLKWNMLTILVVEAIKSYAGEPIHTQQITDYVIYHGGIDIENRRARPLVRSSVRACLKRLKARGRVTHLYNNTEETEGLWTLPCGEV